MIEDKLSQEQRLRLECLAQAIQHGSRHIESRSPKNVIDTAKLFEQYVGTDSYDQ